MKLILETIASSILIVISIDFVGFVAWVMSGQIPPDAVFVGAITKGILSLLIG